MNELEEKMIEDYTYGKITKEEFRQNFPSTLLQNENLSHSILENAFNEKTQKPRIAEAGRLI